MNVGERIRAAREAASLHQSQLAQKADTSQDYISDLERGKHEPGLPILRRIAKALRMKPGKLLD